MLVKLPHVQFRLLNTMFTIDFFIGLEKESTPENALGKVCHGGC